MRRTRERLDLNYREDSMMKPVILALHVAVVMGFPILGESGEPKPLRGDSRGLNFPLSSSKADDRPRMSFDPQEPYRLEFGRGSGWHGLDTVAIEDGKVVLHRLKEDGKETYVWLTGTLPISIDATERIAKTIRRLNLLKMDRSYHAEVNDGTQWIFRLSQDGQEKSIYFDNHFPRAIQDFAVSLDKELAKAGIDEIKWSQVPKAEVRDHEKDLWESIKDHPIKSEKKNE